MSDERLTGEERDRIRERLRRLEGWRVDSQRTLESSLTEKEFETLVPLLTDLPRLLDALDAETQAREAAQARLSIATFFEFKRPKDDYVTYSVHIHAPGLFEKEEKPWEVTVYENGPGGSCLSIPFFVRVKTQDEAWAAYEAWAREALETSE